MAVLTISWRTAVAVSLMAQPLHFAWGRGDAGWDLTPVGASQSATSLVSEVGRIIPSIIGYCVPVGSGDPLPDDIIVPTGRYRASESPTNLLHVRCDFDYGDAVTESIREAGLFMGTVVADGVAPGQRYFEPGEITEQGMLLAIERFPRIIRSSQVREIFEYVLEL